jgi:hypothetical protein
MRGSTERVHFETKSRVSEIRPIAAFLPKNGGLGGRSIDVFDGLTAVGIV